MSEAITRLNAALEGRYRIESELGEGGMATVYLADDIKHERKVALKVLKPELAAVVGAERFLAEIKTTANLTHPHILPLHDSGEADGFVFYVMPYVEGESLREKLDREHQLPVDDAVRIASDVAEALDYAHGRGVIHRDIKPANILIQAGRPVIADFGIALAVSAGGAERLTETGLSVGTPHYMSPEQATGDQTTGPATDTYALGCVLYEMLVGEPPYPGSTAQAVLGKIIQGLPVSATAIRQSVPASVDAAIRKALEKLPADRFTGAQDFAKALADEGFRHGALVGTSAGGVQGQWNRLSAGMTALAAGFALAFGWSLLRPVPPIPVERFVAPFGRGEQPGPGGTSAFNLSPDGSMLVYRGPPNQLWVRRWDDLEPSPIRGTDTGTQPSVSPDGQEVAFQQVGEIRVVSLQGGAVRTLMTGSRPHWGPDGYVYATSASGGLARALATGGPPEEVTRLAENESSHVLSDVLPGGTVGLVSVGDDAGGFEVRALRIDTGEMTTLASGGFPRYASSGHVVFMATDGATLMGARFDQRAMEFLGQPVALLEDLAAFSLSHTGDLFYSSAGGRRMEFIWVTRSGQATPVDPGWSFDSGAGNAAWSMSPDGTRVALRETVDGNDDIWIKQLDNGPYSRLTFHEGQDGSPRWTPDSEIVTFVSIRAGDRDVWTKRADGTGAVELLYDHESSLVEALWSPDGEWLVLRSGAANQAGHTRDILVMRPGVDSVAQPLLAEVFDEQEPALSPDGRWLAYVSNETGSNEVLVRPFPDVDTGRWQISTDGGIMPVWAHSGRELFFVDDVRGLVAVEIDADTVFRTGRKETLFTLPDGVRTSATNTLYGVAPDDQLFLMARRYQGSDQEGAASLFILVQNFFEVLKERMESN